MRILHLANGRLYGGIEQVLATFAGSSGLLQQVTFEFAVCAEARLLDELRARAATVHLLGDVRLSRPATVWRARRRLRELLHSADYGAVVCHAPWAHALFAGAARSHGVPCVFWQHDGATGRPLVERAARAVRADLVICNSRWTAATAASLQPGVPCRVLYYPVPPPAPLPAAERAKLRAALGGSADDVVILSASRFEPYKGHLELVRALAAIRDLPWILWVAGRAQRPHEQRYLSMIQAAARELSVADRVRFLGERRDVPAILASADLLAQANIGPEPFGLIFAEALLAGIPVVTTNMGGAPEIVDNSSGRLVPPGDRAALIRALRDLVADPALRASLGSRGPSHAAALCDPQVVMPLVERTLLSPSTPAAP